MSNVNPKVSLGLKWQLCGQEENYVTWPISTALIKSVILKFEKLWVASLKPGTLPSLNLMGFCAEDWGWGVGPLPGEI